MAPPRRHRGILAAIAVLAPIVAIFVAVLLFIPGEGSCGTVGSVPILCPGGAAPAGLILGLILLAAGVAAAATGASARRARREAQGPQRRGQR